MAINESKKNDSRQWEKWRASGAVAGMPEAKMEAALKDPIKVDATGTYQLDGQPTQTLTLGMHVVYEGKGYTVSEPTVAVVVPGDEYRPGDMVDRKSLPRKTKPVERVFPRSQ